MTTVQGVWKKIPRRLRQKQRRRSTPRRKRRRRTTTGERGDDFYARSFNVFVRMFQLFSFLIRNNTTRSVCERLYSNLLICEEGTRTRERE